MEFLNHWILPPGYHGTPWVYMLTAFVALMLTAVSKGGFGGGVGVVSIPLMLQVSPSAPFVVALWLPVLIACDFATIRQYPKEWSPRAFSRLAPGMLIGIAVTTWLLSTIDLKAPPTHLKTQEAWLKLFIAVIATAFVLMQLLPKKKEADVAWDPPWIASIPVGFIAGVTTMVAHAAGTIITMFFLPMKLDKRVFVGTTGRFFFTFNTLKLPFYLFIGWITWETTRYGIWLMILGPLGVLFGSWMNKRVSAIQFVRLIYIFLIFAVAKLVWDWYGSIFASVAT